MANILNISLDLYKKLEDDDFFNNFVNRSYLSIGDIIGVIKDDLKHSLIIGPNYTRILNCNKSKKFLITTEISKYLKNPIIHYKSISCAINSIELKTNHPIFSKLLGNNNYDNVKIIFDYKNLRLLKFINVNNAKFFYRIDTLFKKDYILLYFLENLQSSYKIVEKTVIVPKMEIDTYIDEKIKAKIMYWDLISCNQILKDDNYEITIKMNIPEIDIISFNETYK
jgi:hypothetical protein